MDESTGYLEAPFPWFGGKRQVASIVWHRFGSVQNYVEPFFGSGAVLFGRPVVEGFETVNDLDGYVCNAWRAIKLDPGAVAFHADRPVFENDLHAIHAWLLRFRDELPARLEGDLDYYDPKVAGLWVWAISCWIGRDFCSGKGPWSVRDAKLYKSHDFGGGLMGIYRSLPHLTGGRGIHRTRPHLAGAMGVHSSRNGDLLHWFQKLSERLRRVRVCCGDWKRVLGFTPTVNLGTTAVFLDPPYGAEAKRDSNLYRCEDAAQLSSEVREWAIAAGRDRRMRIALCGYEGEHAMPSDWSVIAWKARGGYSNQARDRSDNPLRERIWFSPGCCRDDQLDFEF